MNNDDQALDLYLKAKESCCAGKLVDAIQLLEKSVLLHEHFKTRELMGICFQEIGNLNSALVNLQIAYSLNDKSSKTACLLANILLSMGKISECKEIIDNVLIRNVDYGPAITIKNQLHELAIILPE